MAQIDWVHLRLLNWARWSTEKASHGLGYPRAAAFTRDPGAGRHAEERNAIPVDSIAASAMEDAVQALRFHDGVLHALIIFYYLRGATRGDVCARLCFGQRRFYQRLGDAHAWFAAWLSSARNLP